MKFLIILALTATTAYSQVSTNTNSLSTQSAGTLSGSTTAGSRSGTATNGTNSIQRTFSSDAAPLNQDNVGTSQSSTLRGAASTNQIMNSNNSINNTSGATTTLPANTPANTPSTGVNNCVDVSGRVYGNGDAGYSACVNSVR